MSGQSQVQLARGTKKVVHSAITATTPSVNQESRGHNALILYFNLTAGTGTWTIKIQGKVPGTTDTYVDAYDNNYNPMAILATTTSQSRLLIGIPDDFRIVATEDVNGATVTIAYELISV